MDQKVTQKLPDYKINNYRVKRYQQGVLLTTDNGFWTFLSRQEYRSLKINDISPELFYKLEKDGLVVTERNQKKIIGQHKDYNWHLFTGTTLHIVEPTLRCNHTCKYCYANRRPPTEPGWDMNKETAKNLVDFIFSGPAHCMRIEFTGGEPLMNFPVIKYIIQYASEVNEKFKKDVDFAIITNSTMLEDNMVNFFKKYDVGLCFSLDGPKELHDKHRKFFDKKSSLNGETSTYDTVTNWIKRIKDDFNYGHRLNAVPVITKFSIPYWKQIVDEYIKWDFKNLRLKYMTAFGFADKGWNAIGYTYEEYLTLWKNSIKYMLDLNKNGIDIRDGLSTTILTKVLKSKNPGYAELQCPCGAVLGQMVYTDNGDVYTCDEARTYPEFHLGNVNHNSYKEVTTHPTACSMIDASSNLSFLCDSCPWYSFCGLCPLQTYTMQNSLVSKTPLDIKCRMHMDMIDYLFQKILFNPEEKKILKGWIGMHDTF